MLLAQVSICSCLMPVYMTLRAVGQLRGDSGCRICPCRVTSVWGLLDCTEQRRWRRTWTYNLFKCRCSSFTNNFNSLSKLRSVSPTVANCFGLLVTSVTSQYAEIAGSPGLSISWKKLRKEGNSLKYLSGYEIFWSHSIKAGVSDVSWMITNNVQLNDDKPDALLYSRWRNQPSLVSPPSHSKVGETNIAFTSSVVIWDSLLHHSW